MVSPATPGGAAAGGKRLGLTLRRRRHAHLGGHGVAGGDLQAVYLKESTFS